MAVRELDCQMAKLLMVADDEYREAVWRQSPELEIGDPNANYSTPRPEILIPRGAN
jgi:hypothetical protein